jgi:MFS family permease
LFALKQDRNLGAEKSSAAFSPDIWWLIGFRIILGIGIGGDYPVSATLMSEFSGKKSRGMIATVALPHGSRCSVVPTR